MANDPCRADVRRMRILLFFSLRLREEGGSEQTLPRLIAAAREAVNVDPGALSQFEAALIQAGYSPAHEAEYSRLRLRVIDEMLYQVNESFPRITSQSFPLGVPTGVEEVRYQVNLSAAAGSVLASAPTHSSVSTLLS